MKNSSTTSRLISLDAFRGFTIASMVLVNNPGDWGSVYHQLDHAEWNGWTFTDWIFPFFLFIGGVSMMLSLSKRLATKSTNPTNPDERFSLVLQLWKRAAIIFLIGLTLNFIPNFSLETLRIPGVLQRIALCIVCVAPMAVYLNWRQQCWAIAVLLTTYTLTMLYVPVPDAAGVVAAGALAPGRDVGAYVDRLFLSGHLWAKVKTWDPEGLFSTLPAVASMLFGVLLGHWLAIDRAFTKSRAEKTVWMMLAGLLCLWIGAMMDVAIMPINKSLWTTSYAIFMTGWALLLFAAFYWLIDGNDSVSLRTRAQKWFLPFTIYGMNALFIFAFSGLVARMLNVIKFTPANGELLSLKAALFAPLKALPLTSHNQSLLFAILFNLAMFAVAWFMWKKKWFVKV